MKIKSLLTGIALVFCQAAYAATAPGTVTLAWNPSPDPHVNGYRIYEGVNSRTYTNIVNVGNVTNVTLANLVPAQPYFFAATAVTIAGLESQLSNEITYTSPLPAPPVITSQPVSSTNDYGASLTLVVIATGASPLTYQWFKDGVVMSGATANTITLPSLSWVNNGSYMCTVGNPAGSVSTTNAIVSVRPPAPTNFRAVGP